MDSNTRLQLKLRITRNSVGKTQEETAREIGISLRTYQRLENGKTSPDMETIYKLSKVFGLSLTTLSSPQLSVSDCPSISFFEEEKDIYSHPEVDAKSLKVIKQGIYNPLNGKIKINNSLYEKNQDFRESKAPLFVSDIKNTVVNRTLLKSQEEKPEGPWDLSKDLTSLSDYIKAWEITLRDQLAGFFVLGESQTKHLHHIIKPDQENVVVLGQIIK